MHAEIADDAKQGLELGRKHPEDGQTKKMIKKIQVVKKSGEDQKVPLEGERDAELVQQEVS